MPTRLEIELTSRRDDGTWTWRAAGAKKPRGTVSDAVVPDGSAVGDVLKAEADVSLEGTTILSVTSGGRVRKEPDRIELLARADDGPLVTQQLDPRGGRDTRDRKRRDRDRGGDRPDRERGKRGERRPDGDEKGERRRSRPPRPTVPPPPRRPKAPRLNAGRAHRNEVLAALPPEHKPIAEQVLRGGLAGVREALDKQNEQLKAEGKPEVKSDALMGLAESLLPRLRTAEWLDRAEAALAQLADVDLRDLRSVVTAADRAARTDDTRELAAQLRTGLQERLDGELRLWIEDLTEAADNGRTVRALHLTSRPPKAGTPVPPELAERITAMTNAALSADAPADRWARILDALSFSPIRGAIVPASLPTEPSPELIAAVRQHGDRLPDIAHIFGVTPETPAERRKRRAATPRKSAGASKRGPKKPRPGAEKPASDEEPRTDEALPAAETPAPDESTTVTDTAVAEETVTAEDSTAPEDSLTDDAPTAADIDAPAGEPAEVSGDQ